MSNGDKQPSQKSLGKRPAAGTQNASGTQARSKRVLPSRSRRGGPGIGSSDVDNVILDAQKRKFENEPLVPASSAILLTTNSRLATSSSASAIDAEDNAFERYFDRPEVSEAYKRQQIIETPEFSLLSEDASVGGRFRPRGLEDESADTSDAAYEKRHRKYETFEKRQRLREKEKLKHEQYKLKERIEQLRGMDSSAFLALPAAVFGNSAKVIDEDDTGIRDLPGVHVNGAAIHNEGERRRKEILETAAALEERYRVLLPPDRVKALEKERATTTPPISASVAPEPEKKKSTRGQEIEAEPDATPSLPAEKVKLKIKLPQRDTPMIEDTEVKPVSTRRRSSIRASAPPGRPRTRSFVMEPPAIDEDLSASISSAPAPAPIPVSPPATAPASNHTPSPSPSPAPTSIPIHDTIPILIPAPEPSSPITSITNVEDVPTLDVPPVDHAPPRKRSRRAISVVDSVVNAELISTEDTKRVRNRTISGTDSGNLSMLMIAAIRSSGDGRKAQRTQRHVTAFGVKVPQDLEEIRDFEIPDWIRESVHMADENVPPEIQPATWFAEQVNGGSHVAKSVSVSGGGEPTAPETTVSDVDVKMGSE